MKRTVCDTEKYRRYLGTALSLLALLLAVGGSCAWFLFNREVSLGNAPNSHMKVAAGGGDLTVSLDGENWYAAIDPPYRPVTYFIDVSGDGEHLYFPKKLDSLDEPVLSSLVEVTGQEGYYETLRLYFRTSRSMEVFLAAGSAVSPLQLSIESGSTTFERGSLYGSFSCDGIAGAARVAFLEVIPEEEGERLEMKSLWIPNDSCELRYRDASHADFLVSGQSELEQRGYRCLVRRDGAFGVKEFGEEDFSSGRVLLGRGDLATAEKGAGNALPLLSFTADGSLQEKCLEIRLWFEGTDREADKALNGGMVSYFLNFLGLDEEPET